MKKFKYAVAASTIILLTACGGGGGGGSSGPVASTNSFALQSGYTSLISSGWSKTFSITGTCNGTLTITAGPATTSTTFESLPALSGNEVGTFSWTGCTPSSGSTTIVRYFDTNYVPKGFSVVGGDYAVYTTGPTVPSTARVGDVVVVGTLTKYVSSLNRTVTGHQDTTLVMEPDTATTAIANIISKSYNSINTLISTEQDRYRVAANGTLTPISVDIAYSNGTHITGN